MSMDIHRLRTEILKIMNWDMGDIDRLAKFVAREIIKARIDELRTRSFSDEGISDRIKELKEELEAL